MKELLLMRHAKSDWSNQGQSDHDRTLNKRGQSDAELMGRFIKNKNTVPDLVFVSSAKRAQQTFQLWAKGCGFEGSSITRKELYLSSATQYLSQVTGYQGDAQRLMIIGHNPVMEDLASALISNPADTHIAFPTSAMVLIRFDIKHWAEASPYSGILRWHEVPKAIR